MSESSNVATAPNALNLHNSNLDTIRVSVLKSFWWAWALVLTSGAILLS